MSDESTRRQILDNQLKVHRYIKLWKKERGGRIRVFN